MRVIGIHFYPCREGCGFMKKVGEYHPNDELEITWILWQCRNCYSSAHTNAKTGELIDYVGIARRFGDGWIQ